MTIKQVAKRARVSIATVSRTLHNSASVSPETAERVRRAIKHFDYHPDTNAQTLVFLDVGKVRKGVCNIKVDYAQGITQAVDHLRGLGHSRIAFISGPSTLKSARVRREAFLRCLGRRVTEHSDLVEEGNHKVDGGLSAITRLLQRQNPPTAVLASNDLTAIGELRLVRRRGLTIPEDVSVVGFDDIDMTHFTDPPLTTVRL